MDIEPWLDLFGVSIAVGSLPLVMARWIWNEHRETPKPLRVAVKQTASNMSEAAVWLLIALFLMISIDRWGWNFLWLALGSTVIAALLFLADAYKSSRRTRRLRERKTSELP